MRFARRYGIVALAKHAHVTTDRNGGNGKFGAIFERAAPQNSAESDRKTQYLHAYATRHPEVAKFMHRDEHADRHEIDECVEKKSGHVGQIAYVELQQLVSGVSIKRKR